ncbi:hypothetical protein GCM10022268_23850 [Sphingomonas cynarae]|uniref:Uncharacterized protein n=1 Tax=Sphingomonas cynarae TaxID=930197 RepID=A0ABP7E6Q0_9SPHN
MTTTIGDLLANVILHRDAALATEDQGERQQLALDVVQEALMAMHKLLGKDLLTAALGDVDETDRIALLETAARRLHVLSSVFGMMPVDAAGPFAIAEEAWAVAHGDAPLMFARITGQKVKHRVLKAKLEALAWDAYLEGLGLAPGDRHARIGKAFGTDWSTIEKWRQRDVWAAMSAVNIKYVIDLARSEGWRKVPRWKLLGNTDWEAALISDGRRYLEILAHNKGNR